MAEAGRSRELVARAAWQSTLNDEESRAYLQSRLVVLSNRSFWSFIVFIAYIEAMYAVFPTVRPARDATILLGSAGGLIVLLVVWLGFLVRRKLSIRVLNGIDTLYAFGTGFCFAFGAYLAVDFKPAPYTCLLFTSLMVLARAIIVPSSAARTLVMSMVAFAPFFVIGVVLSIEGWEADLPTLTIVSSVFLIFGVVTLLAVTGSRMVYDLRQHSSVAKQLGQYSLDRKLAVGGMGEVWLANHVLLRRPTAVKKLLPDKIGADTVDRFEREVRHMSQLSHPNNVAIYDYGRSPDGVFYYAMEYLDGVDLESLVRDWGALPHGRVVAILVQVCGALEEAHRSGVIHRDIKPANIILCERGGQPDVAKVVDYGLVKRIGSSEADLDDERSNLTLDTEAILGTPGYIAPEAITQKPLGPATDLYSLGALAYFVLTGKPAFEGKTAMAICIDHITKTPVPPSQATTNPIPPELEGIIMQCLAKEPADRPASADALARLLATIPASDWDADKALAWWRTFRLQVRTATPSVGPSTMNIDLAGRMTVQTPRLPQD